MMKIFTRDNTERFQQYLNKHYHWTIAFSDDEKETLQALNVGSLKGCCNLINQMNSSLMSSQDYGEANVRWLIAQSRQVPLKTLDCTLRLLQQYKPIDVGIFQKFSNVMSSFNSQAGEAFLTVFNQMLEKRRYPAVESITSLSAFDVLLALKDKNSIVIILLELFKLGKKNQGIYSYITNHFKVLATFENVDALKVILVIVTFLHKASIEGQWCYGEKILEYYTFSARCFQSGAHEVRGLQELHLYHQVLSILDQNELLTEHNIRTIQQLKIKPDTLYIKLRGREIASQQELNQLLSSINEERTREHIPGVSVGTLPWIRSATRNHNPISHSSSLMHSVGLFSDVNNNTYSSRSHSSAQSVDTLPRYTEEDPKESNVSFMR